jgi:MFS family permease
MNALSGLKGLLVIVGVIVAVVAVLYVVTKLSDRFGRHLARRRDDFDFDKITTRVLVPMGTIILILVVLFLPKEEKADFIYRTLGGLLVGGVFPLLVWVFTVRVMEEGFTDEKKHMERIRIT